MTGGWRRPGPRGSVAIKQERSITISLPSVPLLLSMSRRAELEHNSIARERLSMQILRLHPRPRESETGEGAGGQSSNLCFPQPSPDPDAHSSVRRTCTEARSPCCFQRGWSQQICLESWLSRFLAVLSLVWASVSLQQPHVVMIKIRGVRTCTFPRRLPGVQGVLSECQLSFLILTGHFIYTPLAQS